MSTFTDPVALLVAICTVYLSLNLLVAFLAQSPHLSTFPLRSHTANPECCPVQNDREMGSPRARAWIGAGLGGINRTARSPPTSARLSHPWPQIQCHYMITAR